MCRRSTPPCCAQAAAALAEHDAVFVPALDGGYALVGLRRPAPQLFRRHRLEHPAGDGADARAGATGRAALGRAAAVADIDEPADLAHLPAGWLP